MKLKQIPAGINRRMEAPTISVYPYNRKLFFNAPSVKLLSLNAGECISLFQDEDSPKDWYFHKTSPEGRTAGSVRLNAMAGREALLVYHGAAAQAILRSIGSYETTTFYIANEQVQIDEKAYWKILTDKIVK